MQTFYYPKTIRGIDIAVSDMFNNTLRLDIYIKKMVVTQNIARYIIKITYFMSYSCNIIIMYLIL